MEEKSRILKKINNECLGGSENQLRLLTKYLSDESFSKINLILNNTDPNLLEKDRVNILWFHHFVNQVESKTYQPGYVPIYVKDIKFPSNSDGPFKLVYSSPTFNRTDPGPMLSVLIYEVNKDYSIPYVMDWK